MSNRSKYDESFKKNAVGLVESGRKASEVARDLGLHVETLYQWVKQYRQPPVASQSVADSKELEALRKENALLRMERDILKKAVGIFSLPSK
ncbi:MAG: transposase [Candidatus Kapaibacterium sp.]|jgi:transposase